ncbi:hypothetical protein [uncultured Streptomyces sp.]|uniref:hypothetical protein n=1 Tax=uncultured Streptomyces sp. TaxID=174707 RepID=UPI00343D6B30
MAPVSLRRTQARAHDPRDQGATVRSGSCLTLSTVVTPCSMMTSRAYAPESEHRPYPPHEVRNPGNARSARRPPGRGGRRKATCRLPGWRWRPLGLGELKAEGADVLRRPTRPPVGRRLSTTAGIKTLTGHTGEVHSVAVSPDGTRLATGDMGR